MTRHRPTYPEIDDYEAVLASRIEHFKLLLNVGIDPVIAAVKIWGPNQVGRLKK